MNLGADVRAFLPEARDEAESLMTDTADVYGLEADGPLDETTGLYTPTRSLVYSGKCRLKLANVQVNAVDVQGQELIIQSSTVSFPVAADTVFPKDYQIVLTASLTDPALVGKRLRVTGPHAQTYATARRYPVEELF